MENNIILNQRCKSVFCHKVYIKKENLTKDGYFNLKKIPNLRIIDNNILGKLRIEYNKTHNEIALIASVPLRTEIGWESYKKALPFDKFLLICNKLGLREKKIYELIKNSEFTFGIHHGKNRIRLSLKPNKFKLTNYLIPLDYEKVYVIKSTPKDIKEKIIKEFSIDNYYLSKSGLLVIYSYLLNKFLKIFYDYKKELLLKFPLTEEVPFWINQKVDLTKAVIIPLLLTDGGEKPACVFISGESNIVHDLWSDACYYEFNKLPSSYKLNYKSIYVTSHRLPLDILEKIKKICPNFKTAPRNEPIENYKNLSQPTISYLFKSSKLEQQIALRLWAITEGSISIHNSKSERLITPNLRIACAHPNLTKELQDIAKNNGVNMSIKKGYTWSNIGGLQTTSIKSAINFLKIGGFIRGVKVAKSRSKVFGGFDKQDVLLGILEFVKRQRENSIYKIGNIQKINKWIRNIIKNNEFKDKLYYIKYFEEKC